MQKATKEVDTYTDEHAKVLDYSPPSLHKPSAAVDDEIHLLSSNENFDEAFELLGVIRQLGEEAPGSMHSIEAACKSFGASEKKLKLFQDDNGSHNRRFDQDDQEMAQTLVASLRETKTLLEHASTLDMLAYGIKAQGIANQLKSKSRAVFDSLVTLENHSFAKKADDDFSKAMKADAANLKKNANIMIERIASENDKEESLSFLRKIRQDIASAVNDEVLDAECADKNKNFESYIEEEVEVLDRMIESIKNLSFDVPEPTSIESITSNEVSKTELEGAGFVTCPVTLEPMEDPVIVDAVCAHCVSRKAFERWSDMGKADCPVCASPLRTLNLIPNVLLREQIELISRLVETKKTTGSTCDGKGSTRTTKENPKDGSMDLEIETELPEVVLVREDTLEEKKEEDLQSPLPSAPPLPAPLPLPLQKNRRFYCNEFQRWGEFDGAVDRVGRMRGAGTLIFDDGSKLEGLWKNNKIDGKGTYRSKSGNIYIGEFDQGLICGKGKCWYTNGGLYEGEFNSKHLFRHGNGKMRYSDDSSYEGTFVDDKREGEGVMMSPDGSAYRGEWRSDKKNGDGILQYSNGDIYQGEFSQDKCNGTGSFITANGASYEGEFSHGQFNGQGIYRYQSGNIYSGQWKDDKKHGAGTMIFKNGDLYTGSYSCNEISGRGTFWRGDGSCYEGSFSRGKYNGVGIYWGPNNTVIVGEFLNSKEVSTVHIRHHDKKTKKIELHLYEDRKSHLAKIENGNQAPVLRSISMKRGLEQIRKHGFESLPRGKPSATTFRMSLKL